MKRMNGIALALLVVLAGCKGAAGQASGARVATELAPNIQDYHVESVAVLGFVNTAGDKEADQMATLLVQSLYQTDKYHFVTAEQFAQDAQRVGVGAEHDRMVSTWRARRTVDEPVVKTVLAATGYDAVLGMEITKWTEVKLQPDQEGTSDTTVGARVALYGNDGTLLWSASHLKVEHSPPYLPSYNTRSTTSGEAVTTAQGAVPNPPDIKKVALEASQELAQTMPLIRKAE